MKAVDTDNTSHAAYQLVSSLKTFVYSAAKGMGSESISFSKFSLSLGKGVG